MAEHRWRRMDIGLMAALVICALTACVVVSLVVPRRGGAAFAVDQHIGSARVLGYATWNADCPPFTGCEPTSKQSYVVWVIEAHGGVGDVRNSRRLVAVPLELWK